jgi:hypothetical protein
VAIDPYIVLGSAIVGLLVGMTGAALHMRAGTVNFKLVRWMVLGSVPAAFVGAYLLHLLAHAKSAQNNIEVFLGAALLVGAGAMALRFALDRRGKPGRTALVTDVNARPILTLATGSWAAWWSA